MKNALCVFLCILFSQQSVFTQNSAGVFTSLTDSMDATIFTALTQQGEVLEINLTTDMDHLLQNKKKSKYQPATFSYLTSNGKIIDYQIKVRARGKTRRRTCDFPPLKVKFSKTELAEAGYLPMHSFKMVTHCFNSSDAQQNVLKEYLAYKLYNQLEPVSYRVQLAKINYVDSKTGNIEFESYAFLIESTRELAMRNNMQHVEQYNVSFSNLDAEQSQKLSLFQYFIGNADWNLGMMHNIKLFKTNTIGQLIAVPYDFDFAGLVNAKHAKPNPDFKQKKVRDRVYLGAPINNQLKSFHQFTDQKETLLNTVQNFELLTKRNRQDVIRFLEEFYTHIQNPDLVREGYIEASAELFNK